MFETFKSSYNCASAKEKQVREAHKAVLSEYYTVSLSIEIDMLINILCFDQRAQGLTKKTHKKSLYHYFSIRMIKKWLFSWLRFSFESSEFN